MAEINNLPPASIDAEEAILGGILFDPEAITRVAELVVKNAFYVKAHQEIYHAALSLNSKGKPTDFISISTYLSDRDLLEQVGGTAKLAQLLNRTVSAVNIDRYANLIMEKYIRRQLITSGHEIVDLGYDNATELETVLDSAEQKIFRLTQERPQEGLVPIAETLVNTFNTIEELHQDTALPGVPTGYYDLDAMTSGFSRSDLIIIAGRPSMGKCLAASSELVCQDGSIRTIEEIYHRGKDSLLTLQPNWQFSWRMPSAFVDDGIKPIYRVTTRLGRKIETTITHPFLTIQGWRSLGLLQVGNKIAVPRQIKAFGNEIISEAKVKLLGYLIGDGCLTKTCPEFTNSNSRLRDDFINAVSAFPGLSCLENDYQGRRTTSIRVSKNKAFVDHNRQIFAQNLQQIINKQNISLNKIASSLEISSSLVKFWLKGDCVPNESTFIRLCNLLGVKPENIVPDGIKTIAKSSPNSLRLWLQKLGLWGKNAHNKSIPQLIFTLQPHLIALFLNRLFATDGWATVLSSGQSQLGYATVSEKLARQIQHLLLRFSVIATLKNRSVKYKGDRTLASRYTAKPCTDKLHNDNGNGTAVATTEGTSATRCLGNPHNALARKQVWQLDITDAKSIKNFIDDIGIFGKEEAVENVRQAISKRKYRTNKDLIPIEIWHELNRKRGKESWISVAKKANIKGYSNIHVGKRALSRERLFNLAYALDDVPLQNLATSEIYWDEIVSIEYVGQQQVYDLTIPETHNFVANDICVHNTAFSLCVASNIAKDSKLPVAVFSLEMSREQLTQRLLSSEARIPSNRLRSGRIAQNEFEQLIGGVESLSELPIYIDDTANLTVMQMRSQVRRLQAQTKDPLGLVMIDYLQLMEGGDNDNRVQQLSKMTRSLKGLARELNVPIVALSQLSRGVEQRTNKRPMLSDLRESGCLSGDSLITMADNGSRVPIKNLVGRSGFKVWALNQTTQKIEPALVSNAFATGVKSAFSLQTALGRKICATANHKFLTIHGWKRLDELVEGDYLAIPRTIPSHFSPTINQAELALLGHLIGDGCTLPRHAIQYTTREKDLADFVALLAKEIFGDDLKPRVNPERNWYQVYLPANYHLTHNVKNPITRWLEELGIFGLRSHQKFIPEIVFQQSKESIAIFLRHLWVTDGCIKLVNGKKTIPTIYYSSSSERLARDVQSLLIRLEINARLSLHPQIGKGKDQYYVTISGKPDIAKFIELVGTLGEYKTQELVKISHHFEQISTNTNRDIIPRDIWKIYAVPSMQQNKMTTRQMQFELGNKYSGTSLYKQNLSRERASKLATVVRSKDIKNLADSDLYWDKITSIKAEGETEVYDLTVPVHHNFIANDIVVHNSIEQDADLVMMIYRDEYYNPDTPDRGITEVSIVKHRNGPVGTIKLLFNAELTKFESLAKPGGY